MFGYQDSPYHNRGRHSGGAEPQERPVKQIFQETGAHPGDSMNPCPDRILEVTKAE